MSTAHDGAGGDSRLAAHAKAYAAGNKDKLERGIQKAGQAADSKYRGQIAKAGQ